MDFAVFLNTINGKLTGTQTVRHGVNPATKQSLAEVPVSTQADVDDAATAAQLAFKKWSKTTFEERRSAIHSFADGLFHYKEEFAELLTTEQGKPISQALAEIDLAVDCLKELSSVTLPEEVLHESEECKILGRYVPIGVVGGIVPWNCPIILACVKIISAIYTGNTLIIKPSPFAPYCCLKLGELGMQYFPPGVLQVLSGGDDLGPMMTIHPSFDKISFTGSSDTGKKVMESCAKTLKRLTLELGGNDAAIVCEDVDVEEIIPKIAIRSFLCSGQICMMIKRLYVHEKIYDQFRDALVSHTETLKSGEGHVPGVFFGPVQNSMQYGKVKSLMEDIEKEGVKAALGGKVRESEGYFITPTIIDNPPETSRIVVEEPFGPVLPLLKWSDECDVIERANDTKMGLGASVWTKDLVRAERIARQLEAGGIWVNSHFDIKATVPVVGHKWSGIGAEFGLSGLKGYCNMQSLWLSKR